MRHAAASRLTPRAALVLLAAALAACGSPRKVAENRPLCERCHGGASGNAAPPTTVGGATSVTDIGVGAHQAHVVAGRLRGPIACEECHVVPADMKAHEAGIAAIAAGTAERVTFRFLGTQDSTTAAWSRATAKCSNTYCHGATLNHGGTNQQPSWTTADGSQAACGTCHFMKGSAVTDFPASHPTGDDNCNGCHPDSVLPDNATINMAGGKHLNGAIDGGCTSCHGAPPATGAHLAHASADAVRYGDTKITRDLRAPTTTTYAFGCGNCHPLDFAAHAVHTGGTPSLVPIIDLSPAGAPAGSLRARNDAAAAYNGVTRTCSGVYCHSTGQATPGFAASPAWNATPGSLGCGGCHGNPPGYSNGGAGSAAANSHVGLLAFDGQLIATGHFAGLPAALHQGSAHGRGIDTQFTGDSGAPITCQTCHYDTADASYSPVSGFYYWNPDGIYDVSPTTAGTIVVDCSTCHGVTPPAGNRVMPWFHVNGVRDVAFDRRTAITGTPTLPAAPNDPTRPYWYTRATTNKDGAPYSLVADAVAGSAVTGIYLKGTTLELELTAAAWNGADKSCSSVACHLGRLAAGSQPLKWGEPLDATATCLICHNK